MLDQLAEECGRKIPTPRLNFALEETVRLRSPSSKDKVPRLFYIALTGYSRPPSWCSPMARGSRPPTTGFWCGSCAVKIRAGPLRLKFRRRPDMVNFMNED
jgi:hypothetical protein